MGSESAPASSHGEHQPNLPLISNAPHGEMAFSFHLQAKALVTCNAPPETTTPQSRPINRPAVARLSVAANGWVTKRARESVSVYLLSFYFKSSKENPNLSEVIGQGNKSIFLSPHRFSLFNIPYVCFSQKESTGSVFLLK